MRAPRMTIKEMQTELARLRRQYEATQHELWRWGDKIDALEKRHKRLVLRTMAKR